jgi:copper oxidase (laccase) domain-containing protein
MIERDLSNLGLVLIYNVEVNTFEDNDYHSYRRSLNAGSQLEGHNYSWLNSKNLTESVLVETAPQILFRC